MGHVFALFIISCAVSNLDYFPFSRSFVSVVGYTLLLSLIEYKTLVMRGDLERANDILPSIPQEHHNRYYLLFLGYIFA